MARRTQSAFQTVTTEGALLPADLLKRVADGDKTLEGLSPDSYHLDPSERINEATNRAWVACRDAWQRFQKQRAELAESDKGTTLTRERWLLVLFRELGYGRLQIAKAIEVEGKTYPISHDWQGVPIHLISFRYDLDHSVPDVSRVSPHSLLQEALNRTQDRLWGFLSNGLQLRILRDNVSFTRTAYVEFDLETMMEGEVYSDFVLLWLLCHQSRVEAQKPEPCWLEKWHQAARQQGTRVLDRLRDGVEKAIEALGQGFLAHRANGPLRRKLAEGALTTQAYYQQVLRLVYRLIFQFVAEDRDLLLTPDATPAARARYARHYSLSRVRQLAERRRGTRHGDLWQGAALVFGLLYKGEPRLGLPGLGSMLFSGRATPDLDGCELANDALLKAVRHLAFAVDRNVLRPVDYKNLGAEELGSVYESLLELHPAINADAATFSLSAVAGSERKTTGSFYTPSSLVNCLLDSALEPVLEETIRKATEHARRAGVTGKDLVGAIERAILNLKLCDPACGSGHFLIAGAHRMAKRLAAIRTGDEEPSPAARRAAFRDVVAHCIYGVDINPMAVELCKVALWLESIDPGRPLSFLDHRIVCGNSLIGATPRLLREGIPDAAFEPITGDDKAVASEYKRRNRDERQGQMNFEWGAMPSVKLGNLVQNYANIASIEDDSLADVETKERRYAELTQSIDYENARLLADAWCAAFVWKKDRSFADCPTHEWFRRIEANPHSLPPWMRDEIARLRDGYNFFHWHLAFPDVLSLAADNEEPKDEQTGWSGGFDIILGNPPWERPKPEPANFFAASRPDVSDAQTSAVREKLLAGLESQDPALFAAWKRHERAVMGSVAFLTQSGRFRLTAAGKFNLGNVFVECSRTIIGRRGRVGVLNVSGLATDDSGKDFIGDLMRTGTLISLYDFENRNGLFPGVHRSYKFSAITLGGSGASTGQADFAFFIQDVSELSVTDRHVSFSAADIRLLNPASGNCPVFRSRRQAELVKQMYRTAQLRPPTSPVLFQWNVEPTFLFVMSDHSHLFHTREQLDLDDRDCASVCPEIEGERYVPLYESKMFHQFDHRWSSLQTDGSQIDLADSDHLLPSRVAVPRYWMRCADAETKLRTLHHNWFIAVREVTNATNERTAIAAILPRYPVGHNAQVFRFQENPVAAVALLANLNAFALDYAARTKIGGSHLSSFILRQLPLLPASSFDECAPWDSRITLRTWLVPRVMELVYTAWDLEPFAQDCGYGGPPLRWVEDRRFKTRCELDAAFFRLYGIERNDVDYIMDTFPIVKRKDEAVHGRYRTKDTILEVYDEMTQAIRTRRAYQTRLNPPPGPPTNADGTFDALPVWLPGQPRPAAWPSHIHPPRDIPAEVRPAAKRPAAAATVDSDVLAVMSYPANDTDKAICAAALAIVEQTAGVSSMDHLDTLLLATHPAWCKVFLNRRERAALEKALGVAPSLLLAGENESICWKDCRDYLERHRKAIQVDHAGKDQPITPGPDLKAVRSALPQGVDQVVKYSLKALATIREIRRDISSLPSEQQKIMRAFEQQHREYAIAG